MDVIADSAAKKVWVSTHTTRVVMNLNHNTDRDILEKLSGVPSKQGYIKALIRADISKDEVSTKGMTKRQRALFERLRDKRE